MLRSQAEAVAILDKQRYVFRRDGESVSVVGLQALISQARERALADERDATAAVVCIAEFVRLGALPMPDPGVLHNTVCAVLEWTRAAAALGDAQEGGS